MNRDPVNWANKTARESLGAAGVSLEPGEWTPTWRTEAGHTMGVHYFPEHGYSLSATHLGDPSGSTLVAPLGTHDPGQVAGRVLGRLREREILGHMRDMYLRAQNNNDPTGTRPGAQRFSRDRALDPRTIWVDPREER